MNEKLLWYTFHQNNSGGRFHRDENVAPLVFIQATSADHANEIAETVGIYFDGVDNHRDCECCGSRWSRIYLDDSGSEVPKYYCEEVYPEHPNDDYRFYPFKS